MIDPKPLFDEESPARPDGALDLSEAPPVALHGVAVAPLDLADAAPVAAAPAYVPSAAIGLSEPTGLAAAMQHGLDRFPDIMRESGFLVRNNLNQLLPLDFDRLAGFGSPTLERAAGLIGEVATLNGRLHEVEAERIVSHVVEAARAHAARRRQVSLLGLLAELSPFDAQAAGQQVAAVHRALLRHLDGITATSASLKRLQATLAAEVTTLAILDGMADHGKMGEVLARRALLFNASAQEVAAALAQVESLALHVQDWTMRCDEVCTVTLPALGYTASL